MSKASFQKRIDTLTARACKAEAEVLELRKELQESQDMLLRCEALISRYSLELRKAKGKKNG